MFRKWFDLIAQGKKKEEYRGIKPYWTKRLENRKYDKIYFKNGYSKNAPFMIVEWKGIKKVGCKRKREYAIQLGKILKIGHYSSSRISKT